MVWGCGGVSGRSLLPGLVLESGVAAGGRERLGDSVKGRERLGESLGHQADINLNLNLNLTFGGYAFTATVPHIDLM